MSDSYRDLRAWQKAMDLVTTVYAMTRPFPRDEVYGLTRQVRDAALSVPSNIAEGKGRKTKRDYVSFLYRARGSLFETQTQLEAARRLKFLADEQYEAVFQQADEAGRVLQGLITSVESQINAES